MKKPLQQQVVGFYKMMEGNSFGADLLFEYLQASNKGLVFFFMGSVARIFAKTLNTFLVVEMFDHISVQKIEQTFQLINPLAGLAGFQKLIEM